MSVLTSITRIAVVGGAAGVIYTAAMGLMPDKTPVPVEQGYANPEHVKLHKPVNENGKREFFLNYDNGQEAVSLPIMAGPNGPLVGDADYYWKSIGDEVKSRLVGESWADINLETRKSILKGELERMIENYGAR